MTWAPEVKKNELEMTNLVIWQRPAVNDSLTPNEMANGKINDGKTELIYPYATSNKSI